MPKELTLRVGDFYKSYKESRDSKFRLSKREYTDIIRLFFTLLAKEIIRGYIWNLPYRMGRIMITKKRLLFDKKPIDWNETRKQGKIVRHRNLHTDGYSFKWTWLKPRRRIFRNGRFYYFQPVCDKHNREVGSRGLAAWIKKCANDPSLRPFDAPLLQKQHTT